jgi:hypothetical protein
MAAMIIYLVLFPLIGAVLLLAGVRFIRMPGSDLTHRLPVLLGVIVLGLLLLPHPRLGSFYETNFLLPLLVIPAVMLLSGRLYLQAKRVLLDERAGAEPSGVRRGEVFVWLALSGLLLLAGAARLFWFLVWDSVYDPIGILFVVPLVGAALAWGAGLASLVTERAVLPRLAYMLVFPALIAGVYAAAGRVDTQVLTLERQERVAAALERYYSRQGSYPDSLEALVPGYLLAVPGPVVIQGQDWCYQSSGSSFQLAYLERDHWSSPHLTAAGYHPTASQAQLRQVCSEQIAAQQQRQPWAAWHAQSD